MPEGYQTTFDSALNIIVPLLLILTVLGFVYVKFLIPSGLADKVKGWFVKKDEDRHVVKEITYD